MKKTILGFTVILLMCISGMGISPVRAYTVTVQKDGIYGEKIPDTVIDNAPALDFFTTNSIAASFKKV